MKETLEKIKKTLESNATLLVESSNNLGTAEKGTILSKKVIDSRFSDIKQYIDSFSDKNNEFYVSLIKLTSAYLNELYTRRIELSDVTVVTPSGETLSLDASHFDYRDEIDLEQANRKLAVELFYCLCDILESNKDIVIDIKTLTSLFHHIELSRLSKEDSYINNHFDFQKLARIINKNCTLKKSNISINEVYQMLIDTHQITNGDVLCELVKPEDYKMDHKKIDEILKKCKAKTFVTIVRVIRDYLDKDIDIIQLIKQRNKHGFCESVIANILESSYSEKDIDLIHSLLTDKEIEIDYNFNYVDTYGDSDLKSLIALSGNRIIIKDLLSKESNIDNCYYHGDTSIQLYTLYAIIGDYDKALKEFLGTYHYKHDFTEDFNDDFNEVGYTYGNINYEDSLVCFIKKIIASFKIDNIDYLEIKRLIYKILDCKNVQYINLEETMSILIDVLTDDDLQSLLESLLKKHNDGALEFITVTKESDTINRAYKIKVASDEEIQESVTELNRKRKKALELTEAN